MLGSSCSRCCSYPLNSAHLGHQHRQQPAQVGPSSLWSKVVAAGSSRAAAPAAAHQPWQGSDDQAWFNAAFHAGDASAHASFTSIGSLGAPDQASALLSCARRGTAYMLPHLPLLIGSRTLRWMSPCQQGPCSGLAAAPSAQRCPPPSGTCSPPATASRALARRPRKPAPRSTGRPGLRFILLQGIMRACRGMP